MSYNRVRKKRGAVTSWKVLRRCVVFFTTICVIPVLLVLLVATDQYLRPNNRKFGFQRPEFKIPDEPKKMTRNMSTMSLRMEKRRKHLKKACKSFGLDIPANDSLHKPNPWEFLVDRNHQLVWCNVFKAASTSWMYNFNILAGYSPKFLAKTKSVPLNLARQRYPRPTLKELRAAFVNSTSFLIVRHPLERLLSAYRDKLQYSLPNTHHRKLGNEIVAKYRKRRSNSTLIKMFRQRWPTFSEFVCYLLDSVSKGRELDMHWAPIVEFCTPCMFDFDIIAHTETLQEDQEYIIYKSELQDVLKPQWKNPGKGATSNQIQMYYSQLTRAQILQLYHIYRYDFELFNYSLNGYLEVGQIDKDPSTLLAAITMKDRRKRKKERNINTL